MKKSLIAIVLLSNIVFYSCKSNKGKEVEAVINSEFRNEIKPKVVLAQWTFNRSLFAGEITTVDFLNEASKLGFEGVEFVNQFFDDKVEDDEYLSNLRSESEKLGVDITLLAVDVQGARLGASDKEERESAIEKHKKWIVAASKLDCPNIRVNAHGDGTAHDVMENVFESVQELAIYGKRYKVGVTIENHGQYSSDGKWLSTLVGRLMPYGVGSVADFDNWCIEREDGKLWGSPCINEYDRYLGIKELLPTAKSISIKAFDFDENGEPVKTDFKRMFDLIRASEYDTYLAVEFEGHDLDPIEGVKKILALIDKYLED
jgi:sugar phosphate isomerase/epimerase